MFLQEIKTLFFPPFCMACGDAVVSRPPLMCSACLEAMPRLDPRERCPRCFDLLESPTCTSCKNACASLRYAAVFSYDSPAASLVKKLKGEGDEKYASLMAAWMVMQLNELNFSWPDAIIPVPQAMPRRFVRGYNPAERLAREFSALTQIPVIKALRRSWAALPQTSKSASERKELSPEEFVLASRSRLEDKRLLLIDDVITTGSTVKCCAAALEPAFPQAIYALSFALVS